MGDERRGDGSHQVEIAMGRHDEERAVLGERVEGVEHLDGDQHGQRERGGLDLSLGEEGAGIREGAPALQREVGPGGALSMSHQLGERHEGMAVGRVVEHIPIHEDPHGGHAHVEADDDVAEEHEGRDESLVARSRRLGHDVGLGRVEAQRGGWRSVGHQIHPEQLHGREALGNAQHRREEDRSDLPDVGADQIANKRLHVLVDGPAFLDRSHDRAEIIVHQHHVRRLFRHFRAADPHRHADIRLLQRRSVVHTVSRHRCDLPHLTKQTDQLLLVHRLRTSEHAASMSRQDPKLPLSREFHEFAG